MSDERSSLTMEEFLELFHQFGESAFRLETLPKYSIDDELPEFEAFMAGKPVPQSMLERPWLDLLREATANGKEFSRVHVIDRLNDHLRYQIEWGYPQNAAAGDQIGILQTSDPEGVFGSLPHEDFWLFDDSMVVPCHYDDEGHFLEATKVTDPKTVAEYVKTKDVAIKYATPLDEYRRDHKVELARRSNGGMSSRHL